MLIHDGGKISWRECQFMTEKTNHDGVTQFQRLNLFIGIILKGGPLGRLGVPWLANSAKVSARVPAPSRAEREKEETGKIGLWASIDVSMGNMSSSHNYPISWRGNIGFMPPRMVFHDGELISWREFEFMTEKKISWREIMRFHDAEKIPWRESVIHDAKKFISWRRWNFMTPRRSTFRMLNNPWEWLHTDSGTDHMRETKTAAQTMYLSIYD